MSDPIMRISGLTPKYLPLPHPTSAPIDPRGMDLNVVKLIYNWSSWMDHLPQKVIHNGPWLTGFKITK